MEVLWSDIYGFGKSRISETSYIWIVIVPIAVKLLRKVRDQDVMILGVVYDIDTDLPFSWYLFYFGAVFFSIGVTIFRFRCPEIVKKFRNYQDFAGQQYSQTYLVALGEDLGINVELNMIHNRAMLTQSTYKDAQAKKIILDEGSREYFEVIYNASDKLRPFSRFFASLFFGLGMVLFLVVLGKNLLYVINDMLA